VNDKLKRLLQYLLSERGDNIPIPEGEGEGFTLFRALCNVRPPLPVPEEILALQDEYLTDLSQRRGVVELPKSAPRLSIWQGDITRLKADAIVNAANAALLGCFQPNHSCIDNAIHTYAGMQLRLKCHELMRGGREPTGQARITPGYNLPCQYVLHTVGPIVSGPLNREHEALLASCYRSCLALAEENRVGSIAFCCISTGVFLFPNRRAAQIAVETVKDYLASTGSDMKVIFNVFKDVDREIYTELLR